MVILADCSGTLYFAYLIITVGQYFFAIGVLEQNRINFVQSHGKCRCSPGYIRRKNIILQRVMRFVYSCKRNRHSVSLLLWIPCQIKNERFLSTPLVVCCISLVLFASTTKLENVLKQLFFNYLLYTFHGKLQSRGVMLLLLLSTIFDSRLDRRKILTPMVLEIYW